MIEKIINSIASVLEEDAEQKELKKDMDFINDIGLDSLQLINVILDLEEQCDVNIDFDEFDFDEIHTIALLADYLEELTKHEE